MNKDEALKLALEALELHGKQYPHMVKGYCLDAITAIKDALAQPEQNWKTPPQEDAPLVKWAKEQERNFCPRCGKRTPDSATIHTCTPPIAAGSQAFHGFPHGPVSTPNAGGKCVTAGETAPPKEIDPNQWAFDNGLEST